MPIRNEPVIAPVTLISGFLGSGKTTLLRRLLQRGDRRIGVIVNEFGALGIDGALIAQSGAGLLIELNGGCVCCVAGSDLILALETLSEAGPLDAIAIELSGLAEPGAIIRQLRRADAPLDTVVTLASTVDYERVITTSPLVTRQIQLADVVLLTHSDLVDANTVQWVATQISRLNPRAPVVPVVQGDIAPAFIFSPRHGRDIPEEFYHQHSEYQAVSWQSDRPVQRSALEQTLRELSARGLFRAKGIVFCTDSPWADEVHVVAGRMTFSVLRLTHEPSPLCRLVLIGSTAAIAMADETLNACIDSAERITDWQSRRAEIA
ncbi:CobW family GTP-binding protein [Chloroflexus aggregans]|uniref:Cobalamin synthesis protein P47K n=1 Tax=Chloroflexus aggregans (strain MD-66 / DSM 9485) TaxID=326427 RepID=B8GCU4_CHLAD|nr:CobW family GTP-binding protein [Chloroflexus aggregans]ACL23144.1 cobalamin synthesis protein P47K [Chloroflexus aggregans DSM 9485]